MNIRKRLSFVSAALMLCFTLAACDKGESPNSQPVSEPIPRISGEETATTSASDDTGSDVQADADADSHPVVDSSTSAAATATTTQQAENSVAETTSTTGSKVTRTTCNTTTIAKTTATTRKTTTAKATTTTGKTTPGSGTTQVTAQMLAIIEAEFLRLVNEERAVQGAAALTVDPHLDAAAQVRGSEIMTLFSHTRPDGRDCFTAIDRSKYAYDKVGENIGTSGFTPGTGISSNDVFTGSEEQLKTTAANMFRMFKNSSGHYENMINPAFKHTGIGVLWKIHDTVGVPVFYFAHFFGAA